MAINLSRDTTACVYYNTGQLNSVTKAMKGHGVVLVVTGDGIERGTNKYFIHLI